MEKIDVVLVMLKSDSLEGTAKNLNFDKINLVAIIMTSKAKSFTVVDDENIAEEQIPIVPFTKTPDYVKKYKNSTWLISGAKNLNEITKMKNFLMASGIAEKNIVNFEISSQISPTWLANLRYAEKYNVDFFATGNEYIRDSLNLNFISTPVENDSYDNENFFEDSKNRDFIINDSLDFSHGDADKDFSIVQPSLSISNNGVNLCDVGQNLWQSYLTAKHLFEYVQHGAIKFVLIGLTPDSFFCDNATDFSRYPKNLQYLFAVENVTEDENSHDSILKNLISNNVKDIFTNATSEQADLNFDAIKKAMKRSFSAKSIMNWQSTTNFSATDDIVEKNVQILEDYIKLCLDNGTRPVGVVFPVAHAVRKAFDKNVLTRFRETIHQLEENYDFFCVDMFDLNLDYDFFCDMTHLNKDGRMATNSLLALNLYLKNLIPLESFYDKTYEYFHALSNFAPKDDYNMLMERVFNMSVEKISRKNKIKLGFVIRGDVAEWCGDNLYNLFATDKRFETTVFFSLRTDKEKNELVQKEFLRGVEQFKSHGLNVVAIKERNAKVPTQDVLIFLSPYTAQMANVFHLDNLTVRTLVTHITYSFMMSIRSRDFYNRKIFHTAWRIFFSSPIVKELFASYNFVGMPRGVYSGYPRLDIFFDKTAEFKFDWKMAQPDAKKIIWAPHWSINDVTKYATFQWNYKFMYEFAKAHPEISWVVKPHPALFFSAVSEKVFPSLEAFENYLKEWDELPNARVYTGGYYQAIFATSDGMIHDSSSFIAEYQYVNNPMIYLTRERERFNPLGEEILKASYLIDGKDHEGIAALIQKVFIEGNDYKAAERKEVFDKYLNYPEFNGMLASEYIYKSIADEFKEV